MHALKPANDRLLRRRRSDRPLKPRPPAAQREQPPAPAPEALRGAADARYCRGLNVAVASLGLVLALPLLLAIALVVRCTSPGGVLYSQHRVGLDRRVHSAGRAGLCRRHGDLGGHLFTIYKFRTMVLHQAATEEWTQAGDPRVTAVGRVLRRYRLDELPQLVNVLLGDMNVVGPRPEQPAIFARLKDEISNYTARQRILPGITGWAQINQRYDACIEDVRSKLTLDLEYLRCRSAARDLQIMFRTLPVMLGARGAI